MTPRVNLQERFLITEHPIGGVALNLVYIAEKGNGEVKHGIDLNVNSEGTLRFNVRALGDRGKNGSGRDMVLTAMQILKQNKVNVRAIEGIWKEDKDSVNTDKYKENLQQIMRREGKETTTIFEREAAAKDTWTGKIAADFGFTEVARISAEKEHTLVRFILGNE
jgi:hypothetical protein